VKLLTKRSADILGFLDEGTTITGELHFNGKLRIDGNFNGSISTDDKLVIGEHAVVRAQIKAGEIEIAGEVIGNIEATHRAEILPGGRVHGDIHAPILSVSPGSILEGHIRTPGETHIGS
jgi:cytoskeletal protein CcmA (bactofilin family)